MERSAWHQPLRRLLTRRARGDALSTATKGRAFEHEVRHIMEPAGFSVMRGAGSKGELLDERVDLIATKLTAQNEFKAWLTVLGVQCKVRKRLKRNKAARLAAVAEASVVTP
jgi:Holliday junction resolvase